MSFDLPSLLKLEREKKNAILHNTKMEQEKFRRKNVAETEEKLDYLGSPSEKVGIKAAKEMIQEHEKEQFVLKQDRIEWLNKKAKFSKKKLQTYYFHVKTLVDYEISFLRLPYKYSAKSEVTEKGIKVVLKDRFGQIHIGGFHPSGLGLYDEQACRTVVNRIDDKITELENNPPTGLYLP